MRRSYYKFKNAILCIVNAWEVGCVKDFQPCASPWLQPTNVEFVRMVFFFFFNYYSVLFSTKARLHVCVPTFSHLQKYSLCRLLSRFPKALSAHEALTLGSSITVRHKSCTCALQAYPAPKASSGRLQKPHHNCSDRMNWCRQQQTVHAQMCFEDAFWHTNQGRQFEVCSLNRKITTGGNSFGVHVNNLKTKSLLPLSLWSA